MAHSPEKRAEAVADYMGGMQWADVCSKHGISTRSLKVWIDTQKSKQEVKSALCPAESRDKRFNEALENFLGATIVMLQAWAVECSDKEFIRAKPEGVHELGKTVLDRADRFVSLVRAQPPTDLTD